jgi:hypothetical protein
MSVCNHKDAAQDGRCVACGEWIPEYTLGLLRLAEAALDEALEELSDAAAHTSAHVRTKTRTVRDAIRERLA